jgi:hypothetical protein
MSHHMFISTRLDPERQRAREGASMHPSRNESASATEESGPWSSEMRAVTLLLAGFSLIMVLSFTSLALHPRSLCSGLSAGKGEIRCPLLF